MISLLRRLLSWWRYTPTEQAATQHSVTKQDNRDSILFSMWLNRQGDFDTYLAWPRPASEEQKLQTIQQAALLLHLLTTDKLYPALQEAVAEGGKRDNMQGMSQGILHALNTLREQIVMNQDGKEEPLVDPEAVFSKDVK